MPRLVRKRGVLFGLVALGGVILGLGAAVGDGQNEATSIRKLLDKQVADWNRKDLDGFLETYWHDPGVVFLSGATRSDGFDAMRDRYRARYQGEGREMGKLEFTGIEVIPLGPDSAYARGRWQLTMADGKKPSGLFTLILRKMPQGWKIVHDHTST